MKKRLTNMLLMSLCILLMVASAYASETWLYSIDGLKNPHGVAAAPNGNIVVSLPTYNVVKILTGTGALVRQFEITHPTALSVDAAGRILIGIGKFSSDRPPYVTPGEVKIYDSTFNYLGSLGSGAGEFVNPSAIAAGKDGLIYVADSEANTVKVFNADGTLKLSFGQFGSGDGFLNKPRAIAVDDLTGRIYVADKQLVNNVSGARIQAFSSTGGFLSGFGSYGKLISPSGLAFINNKVYVADSYHDLITVFGADGVLQGQFSSPGNTIRVSGAITISADGLLYAAGNVSNNINVFGIDQYSYFDLQPRSLTFEAYENGVLPSSQQISINNAGAAELQWSALASDSWIVINNQAGSLSSGASALLDIGVNQKALAAGEYNGSIAVQNQNGTSRTASVKLTVKKRPLLTVSPSSLSFTAIAGSTDTFVHSLSVSLQNAAEGATWTASTDASCDAPWMTVNPVQAPGSASDAVVTVTAANLAAGTYIGRVTVSAADAAGSPSDVTVTFTVIERSTISVTTNLPEAEFSVKGSNGVSYAGSGLSWSVYDLPDGKYTITYADVPGYIAPLSESKTIAGGGKISFTGNYRDLSATKSVIVSVGGTGVAGKIGIFTPDGILLKEFYPFGPTYYGAINLATGDINGDGIDEIIAGYGFASGKARLAIFDHEGAMLPGTDILPFTTSSGVKVAAADIDGDGTAELIVGNGDAAKADARIRIYKYVNRKLVNSGVNAVVFPSAFGVNVAAADVDGDGHVELVASPGPDPKASPVFRVIKVDMSRGLGKWRLIASGETMTAFAGAYGANVATGDLNGDNVSEIIVTSGSDSNVLVNKLAVMNDDGTPFGIELQLAGGGGMMSAVGDIDADGNSEIMTVHGIRTIKPSIIQEFSGAGQLIQEFRAYQGSQVGVSVAIGQVY